MDRLPAHRTAQMHGLLAGVKTCCASYRLISLCAHCADSLSTSCVRVLKPMCAAHSHQQRTHHELLPRAGTPLLPSWLQASECAACCTRSSAIYTSWAALRDRCPHTASSLRAGAGMWRFRSASAGASIWTQASLRNGGQGAGQQKAACVIVARVSSPACAGAFTWTQGSLRTGDEGERECRRSLCGPGNRTQLTPAGTDGPSAWTQLPLRTQTTLKLPGSLRDLSRHGQLTAVLGQWQY